MVGCRAVLLAGGFAVDDSIPTSPTRGFMTPSPTRVKNRKQSNKALQSIAGCMALERVVRTLSAVRRLQPLSESVSLVVNQCDQPLFYQGGSVDSGTLIPSLASLGLTPQNIIGNGAQSGVEWLGEVHDLQLALQQLGTQVPVLAMAVPAFTVLPGYNMQRIVEHSFIRNRDVIATRKWAPSDMALAMGPPPGSPKKGNTGYLSLSLEGGGADPGASLNGSPHSTGGLGGGTGQHDHAAAAVADVAHPADTSVMPPLREIEMGVQPYLGDDVAVPILLFKPASLAHIQASSAPHSTLVGFVSQMLQNNQLSLHSIDVGPGFVPLTSCDHAHRWVDYFVNNCRPSEGFLQQGPVEHLSKDFNDMYFGRDRMQPDASIKRVPGLSDFKLPPTFYMTQYRRLAADILR